MLKDDDNQEIMKLIDEKPIKTRPEDKFGHQYYVDILKDILKKCPTPYCIGLFGQWGSGKTGIAKILEEELKNEGDKTYEILYFDTWKHSDDTLRRQLLIEIDDTFFEGKKKYATELYCDTKTEPEIGVKFDLKRFLILFICVSLYITIVTSVIFRAKPDNWVYLLLSLVFPALLALLISLDRYIKMITVTKSVEKPTSPEQFEYLFKKEVLEDIRKKRNKKLLIIFDNLDRCDSETVIKTLRGINTFLGEEGCVYIIPCDPKAIRKHIKNQLYQKDNQTTDPDEFLKKIFQISIDIHPLLVSDIKSYAEDFIDQTNLGSHPKRDQIVHVITQGLVDSPRKIKELLNNLAIRYFIAKKFEIERKILPNVITENIDFLGKMMIIKEEWAGFYEEIQRNAKVYTAVVDIMENRIPAQQPEITEKAYKILSEKKELKGFLEGTRLIQNENVDLFLRFNQEPLDVIIPESRRIKDALIYTRRKDELIEIFEDSKKDTEKLRRYIQIIENTLRDEDIKDRFVNIFNSTSTIIDYVPERMRTYFSERVCSLLDRSHLIESVHSLDLNCFKIFRNIESSNPHLKRILREFSSGLIKSETFPKSKLEVLFENSQIITEEIKPITNKFFNVRFKEFKADIIKFLSDYDSKTSSVFLESSFVKNQLEGSITNKPNKENQEIIELYLSLRTIVPLQERNKHYVSKMIEMIKNTGSIECDEPKRFAIDNLDRIKFEIPSDFIIPLIDALDSMQALIVQSKPQPQAFEFIAELYVALYPDVDDKKKADIQSKLSHLIKTKPSSYEKILEEIRSSEQVQRFNGLIGFTTKEYIQTEVYKKKSDEEKNNFLKMLYEEYYQKDIKYFCEHLVFDLLSEGEEPLFNSGLRAINIYIDEIVSHGLEKKLIEILVEEIKQFEDNDSNYEDITNYLNALLLFLRNCTDKNFVDGVLSDLASNFLKSKKSIEKRVIKDNFNKVKDILSEDMIKTMFNNIALYVRDNVTLLSSKDPLFIIILENQDFVDKGNLDSLKNNLKCLILEQNVEQMKKPLYFLPKIKSLTKDQIKEYVGDFLNVAKDEKRPQEVKELAKTAVKELEPRVDKRWLEWKEFESLEKEESKEE